MFPDAPSLHCFTAKPHIESLCLFGEKYLEKDLRENSVFSGAILAQVSHLEQSHKTRGPFENTRAPLHCITSPTTGLTDPGLSPSWHVA